MIDVGAIGQEDIGKGAPILVETVSLERDFFPEGKVSDGVLGPSRGALCVTHIATATTAGARLTT